MKRPWLWITMLAAVLACSTPQGFDDRRDFLPGHSYEIEGRIESSRRLEQRGDREGPWRSLLDERQVVRTSQRLSLDEAGREGIPVRLEVPSYVLSMGEGERVVVLDGYVGEARFRPRERVFDEFRLAGRLDSSALAEATASLVATGSVAEVVGLDSATAWDYFASTLDLLAGSLVDSSRGLQPGEFFSQEQLRQERVGAWPVSWRERSTTTLERIEDGIGRFSILRSLQPTGEAPDSLRLEISGDGRGRMDFDPAIRQPVLFEIRTRLDIELEAPSGAAWRAASNSSIDLRTRARRR
jgi:hypothetical protein